MAHRLSKVVVDLISMYLCAHTSEIQERETDGVPKLSSKFSIKRLPSSTGEVFQGLILNYPISSTRAGISDRSKCFTHL